MIIEVTEGTNQHGGYILKAQGVIFNSLADVVNAFPDDEIAFRPSPPKKPSPKFARDVDYDIFS